MCECEVEGQMPKPKRRTTLERQRYRGTHGGSSLRVEQREPTSLNRIDPPLFRYTSQSVRSGLDYRGRAAISTQSHEQPPVQRCMSSHQYIVT